MTLYVWEFVGGLTDEEAWPDGSTVEVVASSLERARAIASEATVPGIVDGLEPARAYVLADAQAEEIRIYPPFVPTS